MGFFCTGNEWSGELPKESPFPEVYYTFAAIMKLGIVTLYLKNNEQ